MIKQINIIDAASVFTPIYKVCGTEKEALGQCMLKTVQDLTNSPLTTVICWDLPNGGSARRRFVPGYKSNRKDDPDRYKFFTKLEKYFYNLGYLQAKPKTAKFEADDIIALFAKRIPLGILTLVYTRDHDMLQLIRDGLAVLHDEGSSLEEKLVCDPSIIPLYKATVGDASDKIPGVSRFGKKAFENLQDTFDLLQLREIQRMVKSRDVAGFSESIGVYPKSKELAMIANNLTASACSYNAGVLGNMKVDGQIKVSAGVPISVDNLQGLARYKAIGVPTESLEDLLAQEVIGSEEELNTILKEIEETQELG